MTVLTLGPPLPTLFVTCGIQRELKKILAILAKKKNAHTQWRVGQTSTLADRNQRCGLYFSRRFSKITWNVKKRVNTVNRLFHLPTLHIQGIKLG